MAYMNAGYELLKKVEEEVMEEGTVEEQPKQEARNRIAMVIVPK
jgi:translation initiation factor IF-3